jgi:hypothetical protein
MIKSSTGGRGMSREHIKGAVKRFLKEPQAEVLCLRGKWGIGKTHAWNERLDSEVIEGIPFTRYAYCSLFGVNSLAELKASIVETTVVLDKQTGREAPSHKTFMRRMEEAGRWSTGLLRDLLSKVPYVGGLGEAATRLVLLTITRQVICIDDLERRGRALDLGDVLGFASYLKEERQCKVVLILNDEKLVGDSLAIFNTYLEKVVDICVVYQPTPAECAALGTGQPAPPGGALVEKYASLLEITNIRVIKRITRLATILDGFIAASSDGVRQRAIRSLAVAGWIQFLPGEAPTIEFLKDRLSAGVVGLSYGEAERRWNDLLEKVDFVSPTAFDEMLLSVVRDGYFIEEEVSQCLADLDDLQASEQNERDFLKAWEACADTLNPDRDTACTVKSLVDATRPILSDFRPVTLDTIVRTVRGLGFPDEARDLIRSYVEPNFFAERFDDVVDPELRVALEKRAADADNDYSNAQVLEQLAVRGRSPANLNRLRRMTAGQFAEAFLELRRHLGKAIEATADLPDLAENGKSIGWNVREAIEILSAESAVHKVRLDLILERVQRRSGRTGSRA